MTRPPVTDRLRASAERVAKSGPERLQGARNSPARTFLQLAPHSTEH